MKTLIKNGHIVTALQVRKPATTIKLNGAGNDEGGGK